ncbi:MAG: pantothenate kinase [Flavobacteriales bacterium]|nr:pantothenate kinase [Flavobacteriales bacterium]
MNIIIDIGNTNIKLGFFKNNILIKKLIINLGIKNYLKNLSVNQKEIEIVFICGVNTKVIEELKIFFKNYDCKLIFWADINKNIIESEYIKFNTLGFDRLANAVAAINFFANFKNHLVIDLGTCITYDIIIDKVYKGGQISPGLGLRFNSLDFLTKKSLDFKNLEPKLLGKSTDDCVQSGVYFGILGEINNRINYYNSNLKDLNVILTGGDSIYFKKLVKNVIFDQNLLLKGLNLLLNKNEEN